MNQDDLKYLYATMEEKRKALKDFIDITFENSKKGVFDKELPAKREIAVSEWEKSTEDYYMAKSKFDSENTK